MALVVKDRVKETTITTGTGTITLAGAVTGYQAFSAIGNGSTTYYVIEDANGTDWEVGIGTYTLSGTTLARTDVLASTNSNSEINLSSGTHTVFCGYPAGKSVHVGANIDIGSFSFTAETLVSDVATGTAPITVSSTTKVTNLNADQLDDQEGSYYLDFSNFVVEAGEIANAKLANSSITVSDSEGTPNTTAIALGGTLTFAGTANETTVIESGGTITIGLPLSITANLTGNVTGNTSGSSGSCTGNSATATLASTVTVTDSTADTAFPVVFHDESNALLDDTTAFTYNPNSGTLVATAFSGPLTGNVTGNASGSAGSCTGNSATATLASTVTVTDSTSNTDFPIVFHDESNALLDDTGAFEYNPSTGTITLTGAVIDFNGSTGNNKLELTDNLASALDITESSNSYMKFTTTDNASRIVTNVGVVGNTTALTSQSGSVVINAALGNYFTVATSGNITGLDIQNAVVGQKILIRFAWGGDHTLTFTDTVAFPGNTPPGTTASGVDVIGFVCTTASTHFDGFIVGEDLRSS